MISWKPHQQDVKVRVTSLEAQTLYRIDCLFAAEHIRYWRFPAVNALTLPQAPDLLRSPDLESLWTILGVVIVMVYWNLYFAELARVNVGRQCRLLLAVAVFQSNGFPITKH